VTQSEDITEQLEAGIESVSVGEARALLILALYEIRSLRSRTVTHYRGEEIDQLYLDAMKQRAIKA
jgi:hypothetical protein